MNNKLRWTIHITLNWCHDYVANVRDGFVSTTKEKLGLYKPNLLWIFVLALCHCANGDIELFYYIQKL